MVNRGPFEEMIDQYLGDPEHRARRHYDAELTLLKFVTAGNGAGSLASLGLIGATLGRQKDYPILLFGIFFIFLVGLAFGLLAFVFESRAAQHAHGFSDEASVTEIQRLTKIGESSQPARYSNRIERYQAQMEGRRRGFHLALTFLVLGVLLGVAHLYSLAK